MEGMASGDLLLEGASDAFSMARSLFLARYPDGEEWFSLAWEVLSERSSASTEQQQVLLKREFHLSATEGVLATDMVDLAMIFFEAFMLRFPAARNDLVERLASACTRHGKTDAFGAVLQSELEQQPGDTARDFLLVTNAPGIGAISSRVSPEEVGAYIHGCSSFDVFVHKRSVLIRRGQKSIPADLDERVYRLLVIFLRHKDQHLPTDQLYRKAWFPQNPTASVPNTHEEIVQRFLKPAVSQLRRKLASVHAFEVPPKKRYHGYICRGNFSFCVAIDAAAEKQYRLDLLV